MSATHSRDARRPVVIVGGWRTPLARAGGVFAREDAGHIGAAIARETMARCNVSVEDVDEVIVGCAGPPHDQANVGRVIGLRAGVPERVPGRTVARNCASGMEAITSAATAIEAGRGELYLVLGVEMMSRFPLIMNDRLTRWRWIHFCAGGLTTPTWRCACWSSPHPRARPLPNSIASDAASMRRYRY